MIAFADRAAARGRALLQHHLPLQRGAARRQPLHAGRGERGPLPGRPAAPARAPDGAARRGAGGPTRSSRASGRRMNVLMVTPHLPPHQAANALLPHLLGEAFGRRGHAVRVPDLRATDRTRAASASSGADRGGCARRACPRPWRRCGPGARPGRCCAEAEVVHVHSSTWMNQVAARLAVRAGKPYVLTHYGTEIWHHDGERRRASSGFNRDARPRHLLQRARCSSARGRWPCPLRAASVVYPPVADAFRPLRAEERDGGAPSASRPARASLLVNVKRLHPLADQATLLARVRGGPRASARMRVLLVAGTGEMEGAAQGAGGARWASGTAVRFLGLVPNDGGGGAAGRRPTCSCSPPCSRPRPPWPWRRWPAGTPVVSTDNPGGLELREIFGADVAVVPKGDAGALARGRARAPGRIRGRTGARDAAPAHRRALPRRRRGRALPRALRGGAWPREDDRRTPPSREAAAARFRSEYDYAVFEYLRSAKVLQALERAGVSAARPRARRRMRRRRHRALAGRGVGLRGGPRPRGALPRLGHAARAARRRIAQRRLRAGRRGAPALPRRRAFDLVFSHSVIEHVASAEDYLRECFRVLRPGGVLYLSTAPTLSLAGAHLPRLLRAGAAPPPARPPRRLRHLPLAGPPRALDAAGAEGGEHLHRPGRGGQGEAGRPAAGGDGARACTPGSRAPASGSCARTATSPASSGASCPGPCGARSRPRPSRRT